MSSTCSTTRRVSLSETSFRTRRTSRSDRGSGGQRLRRNPKCRSSLPDVWGRNRGRCRRVRMEERLRKVIQSLEMVVESCFGRSTITQDLGDRPIHKTGGPPPPKQRARVSGYEEERDVGVSVCDPRLSHRVNARGGLVSKPNSCYEYRRCHTV